MADIAKYAPPTMKGGAFFSEFKAHFSIGKTKRTVSVAYAFVFVFIAFTIFLAFSPSSNSSSPWFANIFTVGARGSGEIANSPPSSSVFTDESYRSHFSSIYYYFFPNSTTAGSQSQSSGSPPLANSPLKSSNITNSPPKLPADQTTAPKPPVNQTANKTTTPPKPSSAKDQGEKSEDKVGVLKGNSSAVSGNGEKGNMVNNSTSPKPSSGKDQGEKSEDKVGVLKGNSSAVSGNEEKGNMVNNSTTSEPSSEKDQGEKSDDKVEVLKGNSSAVSGNKEKDNMVNNSTSPKTSSEKDRGEKSDDKVGVLNGNSSAAAGNGEKGNMVNNSTSSSVEKKKKQNNANNSNNNNNELIKSLMGCDFFDGNWVKDESYPLYKPDSCSLIDEQFNCFRNGRPDNGYYKLKWKPKGCTLPRLDGSHMLELLRGKRLVFVGDSLNRNMWESLICILRNSVKDQTKVYEENGRHNFRGEASYSFIFKDYKFTVEFFVTPFLVQEWEVEEKNGTKKETLRLDIVSHAASKYKTADIIVFNTGHWWTHDKTALGKDYYQEGSHVYGDLNVLEAFRKAITTWGRWIDANVDPKKSLVFFRGYSASHFSGGQWNSGGQCDHETEPIKNETYLAHYPPKMAVLEKVLRNMKTRVTYLNVTRMTDYRKDGHPSIYRKLHLTDEEKKSPLRFQDCSHWCLPGVPDAWNEILYAELLVKLKQRRT